MVGCAGRAGAGSPLNRVFRTRPYQGVEHEAVYHVDSYQSTAGQRGFPHRSTFGGRGHGEKAQQCRLRRPARTAHGHRVCTAAVLQFD